MALLDLFIAASIPVVKVLLVTALGSFLALDRINILGDDTRKHLNNPLGGWLSKSQELLHICVALYWDVVLQVGAVYLWSYVYNIVRISSRKSSKEAEINDSPVSKSSIETSISQLQSYEEPLLSSKHFVVSEDNALPCTRYEVEAQVASLDKVKQYFGMLLRKLNLKRLFAPSTTGAIVGFIVGLVPQIRMLMIGDAAPLRVIEDSVSLVGDGAIPALTLIVGGNLLKGLQGSGIQKSIIVGVVVARYIALPLIGIVTVKGAVHFGLVPANPLYQFVLYLQFSLPPAMNIGTITQLFGAGESECSVIMLWTYALASISLTIWSTVFMWLVA
ncbi:auxin efflux carrier family protein [Actinidia rufa]|uniref:Auxin efflux carrier family protein n=1 Tax=Actinidia rufa TaxID=165716 RepID=A0A7J0GIJ0_9ERIC|nr:auxin efflux carrier family protein [Actinidia rufa]